MATNGESGTQVEGRWEDLIGNPARFAGKRVRVTVLGEATMHQETTHQEKVDQWLAEGEKLETKPPPSRPDPFGDILIEKYTKQGLKF